MHEPPVLTAVPDDELLRRLAELVHDSRHTEADLVVHIGEVDRRRLYAGAAMPSMFAYCTRLLHLSEAEAFLRITAARAAREHPILLAMLADGRLHLSGIERLAPHLTRENRDTLLSRATHRSKREIEELVAEIAPRPEAPSLMRRLPRPSSREVPASTSCFGTMDSVAYLGAAGGDIAALDSVATDVVSPPTGASRGSVDTRDRAELRPDGVGAPVFARVAVGDVAAGKGAEPDRGDAREQGTGRVAGGPGPLRVKARCVRPVIEPLAVSRYRVQFTASAELKGKLERLQALLRAEVPDGDLGAIIDRAVTDKLQRLEARRYGTTVRSRRSASVGASGQSVHIAVVRPCPSASSIPVIAIPAVEPFPPGDSMVVAESAPSGQSAFGTVIKGCPPDVLRQGKSGTQRHSRHIPAAIRRTVHERDGGRCRFVDETGRRCPESHRLEYHHRYPFGMGGGHAVENVRLMCRTHNLYLAEHDYGRGTIAANRTQRAR